MTTNAGKQNHTILDLVDAMKRAAMLETNCHAVGTIQKYDSAAQTASVSINYLKTYEYTDPQSGVFSTRTKSHPVLVECPVIFMQGGGGFLTFPVAVGDECLLLFNDRDIDNWYSSGQVAELNSGRLHSLSDAFVLVGVRSKAKAIKKFDADNVVLHSPKKVTIENDTTSLFKELSVLIDAIQAGLENAKPGAGAALAPLKIKLGALLG